MSIRKTVLLQLIEKDCGGVYFRDMIKDNNKPRIKKRNKNEIKNKSNIDNDILWDGTIINSPSYNENSTEKKDQEMDKQYTDNDDYENDIYESDNNSDSNSDKNSDSNSDNNNITCINNIIRIDYNNDDNNNNNNDDDDNNNDNDIINNDNVNNNDNKIINNSSINNNDNDNINNNDNDNINNDDNDNINNNDNNNIDNNNIDNNYNNNHNDNINNINDNDNDNNKNENNEITVKLSSDKHTQDISTSSYYVQFRLIDKETIEIKDKQKLINQSRLMATEMAFASQDSNLVRNTKSESSNRTMKRLDNIYGDITYNNFNNGNQHVDSCICEKCRKSGKNIQNRNKSLLKRLNSNGKKMTTKEIYVGINCKKNSLDEKSNICGTFKMIGNVKLVQDLLECHNFQKTKNSDFSLLWTNHYIKGYCFKSLSRWQRVNLFPRSLECTRKDALSRNINTMAHLHGQKHFSFMPECYILPQERDSLLHAFESSCGRPWIVKPAGSSQGRGIYITNNILELPDTNQVTKNNDNWIVERYIENPLLIDNRKFDLRLYVAVTSFNPLKIYLHEEGLARLATEKYSNETYDQKFSHLTNYSINKHNIKNKGLENSNEFDSTKVNDLQGNELKLSFAELNKILKDMGINTNPIWNKIEDLIVKTLISVESKIHSALEIFSVNNESCFELFGFDVLIDSDLNPWLMEVNFAPSLNTDSLLDFKVKSKVLSDLFNLVGVKQTIASGISTSITNSNDILFSHPLSDGLTDEIIKNLKLFDIDLQGDKGKRALTIFIKEMQRSSIGGYKLLFPVCISDGKHISTILKYNNFFEEERALNKLLAQYILATSLKQKDNEEMNTPDKEDSSKKSYTTSRLRAHIINSKEFNSLWGRISGKSIK